MLSDHESQFVIQVEGLTRRYRRTLALDNFSLSVPRGQVVGLVGKSGAGKSTLIKHILGLLRPQSGTVRVLGLDPVEKPVEVLGNLGYVSENRDMPGWMRVRELMRYCQALYPKWDQDYAEELCTLFELDRSAKLRTLSSGQAAKACLLSALAHRPELLVLDEPSAGLDPIARRDILEAMYRGVAKEGRTVLFSSHLLEEVASVVDHVAMVHAGRLIISDSLGELLAGHQRVRIRGQEQPAPAIPSAMGRTYKDGLWTFVMRGAESEVREQVSGNGLDVVSIDTPSLSEIFVAHSGVSIHSETSI